MLGGQKQPVSRKDILMVHYLIELCLVLDMTPEETVQKLQNDAKIEPKFTRLVWQTLSDEYEDFFKTYYSRLELKKQMSQAVKGQVLSQPNATFLHNSKGSHAVSSRTISNGSHNVWPIAIPNSDQSYAVSSLRNFNGFPVVSSISTSNGSDDVFPNVIPYSEGSHAVSSLGNFNGLPGVLSTTISNGSHNVWSNATLLPNSNGSCSFSSPRNFDGLPQISSTTISNGSNDVRLNATLLPNSEGLHAFSSPRNFNGLPVSSTMISNHVFNNGVPSSFYTTPNIPTYYGADKGRANLGLENMQIENVQNSDHSSLYHVFNNGGSSVDMSGYDNWTNMLGDQRTNIGRIQGNNLGMMQ